MQFVAAVIAILLLVVLIKVALGLLGWVISNLIVLVVGAAIGYWYRGTRVT